MAPNDKRTLNKELDELYEGFNLSTGKGYKLVVESPKGILAGYLFDQDMIECCPEYPYEIYDRGQMILTGKTDENGFFMHREFPADYYVLKANDQEHVLVTIQEEDDPAIICIIDEESEASGEDSQA